jgi:transposase
MEHTTQPAFYKQLAEENTRLLFENNCLKQELAQLKRLIFGQKRERFIGGDNNFQLSMDFGLEQAEEPDMSSQTITYERREQSGRVTAHGRNALPAHLPRHDIVIEPSEDVSGMPEIGREVTEELEFKPAEFYVNRYIRPKYKDEVNDRILIGGLPHRPIEKGIPGPGLLSHVFIGKYVDHIPLDRQRKQFLRQGVDLAPSTLGDWVSYSYDLLQSLYEVHCQDILTGDYLMIDETPIRVLDRNRKGKTHTGYFWVYYDPLGRRVFFDYRNSRSREGPNMVLKDYHGFIQTDGYSGYEEVSLRQDINRIGCFAHARRYFENALANDRVRGEWMLKAIQRLYAVESIARDKDLWPEQRYQLRRKESLPILNEIEIWLKKESIQVLPKSLIGKAIGYMLGQWEYLKGYIDDGRFEIDNNLVENAIRPVALGRKNYLFAGSHNGAKRAALLYSLVSTARLQNIEPYAYLKDVLTRISDYPYKNIKDLLPVNLKTSAE